MQIRSLHHVNIKVGDLDEAVRFYTTVLGLSLRDDRPAEFGPGAWIDAGGQQIHLGVGEVPEQKGQHFALVVDDLAGAIAELEAAGVRTPTLHHRTTVITVQDPSGNVVELRQA